MKRMIVLVLLTLVVPMLFACAKKPKETPPPPPRVSLEEAKATYGECGHLAVAILHCKALQEWEDKGGLTAKLLGRFDDKTRVKIVSTAFKSAFTEDDAAQTAAFLESPTGQAVLQVLGDYLLTGEFMNKPLPPELEAAWKQFLATKVGLKWSESAPKIYKETARLAAEAGGNMLKKAVTGK